MKNYLSGEQMSVFAYLQRDKLVRAACLVAVMFVYSFVVILLLYRHATSSCSCPVTSVFDHPSGPSNIFTVKGTETLFRKDYRSSMSHTAAGGRSLSSISTAITMSSTSAPELSPPLLEVSSSPSSSSSSSPSQQQQHAAHGQHVLMDIYGGDSALLNDKTRLVEAMTQMVSGLGMTVLGVVAQQLAPQGVSVTVALKESHFTVHTYPEVGTAFVDLFTCGDLSLLSKLDVMAGVFGAKIEDTTTTKWAFYQRGIAAGDSDHRDGLNDLYFELAYLPDEKKLIHSHQSRYQKIDIWAYRDHDYWFFTGEEPKSVWSKTLYMDGALQSATVDEHKYHESLVHPAMLSHVDGAKRVAILGGGEGATLREVLKYTSVEYVEMIEIDPGIVKVAKDHLPEYHNCSFLVHSTTPDAWNGFFSCFDDPRVRVRHTDAVDYFDYLSRRINNKCRLSKSQQSINTAAEEHQQGGGGQRMLRTGKNGPGLGKERPRKRKNSAVFHTGVAKHLHNATTDSDGRSTEDGQTGTSTNKKRRLMHPQRGVVREWSRNNRIRRFSDSFSPNSMPNALDRPYRRYTGGGYSYSSNSAGRIVRKEGAKEGFDVIIMDLLDPEDHRVDLVDKLYVRDTLASLMCSLRPNGVIVTQFGQAPPAEHPRHHVDTQGTYDKKLKILSDWTNLLDEELSPTSQLFLYNAYIASFYGEWSFALFFSSTKGPNNFQRNAASTDMAIRKRIRPSARPLLYIDGTSMEAYSKLPREWQDAYCLQKHRPAMCDLFNLPSQEDASDESVHEPFLALQPSSMHTDAGQTNRWEVAATVDIPKWTDLGLYDAATSIRLSFDEYNQLEEFVGKTGSKEYTEFLDMINRYAYECSAANGQYIYCGFDSKNTFINHGCENSTINIGSIDHATNVISSSDKNDSAMTRNENNDKAARTGLDDVEEVDDFNLVIQRHERRYCAMSLALKEIKKGESILEDYGAFGDAWKPPDSWCKQE